MAQKSYYRSGHKGERRSLAAAIALKLDATTETGSNGVVEDTADTLRNCVHLLSHLTAALVEAGIIRPGQVPEPLLEIYQNAEEEDEDWSDSQEYYWVDER